MIQYDQWHGQYKDGWKGHITSSSFSHPAKFSKGLIFHIIQHVIDEGWVIPGESTCVDPFAGIGGGALPCALQGIQWLGCELESRFVALANGAECGGDSAKHEACTDTGEHGPHHLLGNLELWQRKYGVLPQWKQPILLQGDSRNLCAIIEAHADLLVSSSPYADTRDPAYVRQNTVRDKTHLPVDATKTSEGQGYGTAPGQLGALPPGSLDAALAPGADLTITSPVFADGCTHTGGADPQPQHVRGGPLRWVHYGAELVVSSSPYVESLQGKDARDYSPEKLQKAKADGSTADRATWGVNAGSTDTLSSKGYGASPSNLGNMPAGDVAAVVQAGADCALVSPPYNSGTVHDGAGIDRSKSTTPGGTRMSRGTPPGGYSAAPENLGNMPAGDVAAVVHGDLDRKNKEIGENCLACAQNPDRMLCSVHNKLSGDSVWQSAKTAESVYHTDAAGACPVVEPTAASLCLPVPSVANNSVVDGGLSAEPVMPENNQQPLQDNPALLKTEQRSPKPIRASAIRTQPKQSSVLSRFDSPNSQPPIQKGGEVSDLEPYAKLSSSETTTPASNVVRQEEGSPSTTSKIQAPPIKSGITAQKTYNPSVDSAISKHTPLPRDHASNAEQFLPEPTSEVVSARNHVGNKDGIANSENARPQDTFWSASKTILQQVFDTLKPGGHAVWVCKHYIRDGKLVDFPGDWQRLATHVGFQTIHIHLAMLVERRVETHLFEGEHTYEQWTESFFRRLSRKKTGVGIEFETVICQVKPLTTAPLPPDEAWEQLPLVEVAECSVSSPSYGGNEKSDYLLSTDGKTRQRDESRGYAQGHGCFRGSETYGQEAGQLGALRVGSVDLALTSPAYGNSLNNEKNGIDWTRMDGGTRDRTREANYRSHNGSGITAQHYGTTTGQLGSMPEGETP